MKVKFNELHFDMVEEIHAESQELLDIVTDKECQRAAP